MGDNMAGQQHFGRCARLIGSYRFPPLMMDASGSMLQLPLS
jgi:hypothetical protein